MAGGLAAFAERNTAKNSPEPCAKSISFSLKYDPWGHGFHLGLGPQQGENLRSRIEKSQVVLPGGIVVRKEAFIEIFENPSECSGTMVFIHRAKGKKRFLRILPGDDFSSLATLRRMPFRYARIEYAQASEGKTAFGHAIQGEPETWRPCMGRIVPKQDQGTLDIRRYESKKAAEVSDVGLPSR